MFLWACRVGVCNLGRMPQMTDSEWRDFVMTGTLTGKLALTRPDGRPHVTPVWFVLDGDDIVLTTGRNSVKGRALQRDPSAALCVDYQEPPYHFVMIEGRVALSDDPGELVRWATAIRRRYMGPENAEQIGARAAVPGELLVRLRAAKVIAQWEMAH
jgi:PPOX class probable F420-dependent enzyme